MPEFLTFKITPHYQDFRIDAYLARMLPWRARHQIAKDIERGIVRLNEKPIKAAKRIKAEDVVRIEVPSSKLMAADLPGKALLPLEIIFEDEYFLAINKPGNLAVHSNKRYLQNNVLSLLKRQRESQGVSAIELAEMRLLHRLDLETSGVLLISKNKLAHLPIAQQFEEKKIQKTYLAIVSGAVLLREGEVRGDIVIDGRSQVGLKKTTTL